MNRQKHPIVFQLFLGLLFGMALSIFHPSLSQAYQLADHKQITEEAIREILTCFPNTQSLLSTNWILLGDLGEDVNLVTKELLYSHYYNPHKKLPMYRYDSSVRISRLETQLRPDLSAAATSGSFSEMLKLGQVIHHLQDATVPPHVVPVAHSLSDGFESFTTVGEIGSGLSCAEIAKIPRVSPTQILVETAEATLATVATEKIQVEAIKEGHVQNLSLGLEAFWKDSSNDDFGVYGILGNNYGRPQFSLKDGTLYNVPSEFYETLKQNQMKFAVRTTLRALVWYLPTL